MHSKVSAPTNQVLRKLIRDAKVTESHCLLECLPQPCKRFCAENVLCNYLLGILKGHHMHIDDK